MAEKYDDVLLPFLSLMRKELHANSRKGDRPGWLAMSADTLLLEVYWHTAKLSAAVKNNDGSAIMEHSADVANMAMMVLDKCGGIAWAALDAAGVDVPRGGEQQWSNRYAPAGKVWLCMMCGKTTRDMYGEERGWDESCALNCIAVDEATKQPTPQEAQEFHAERERRLAEFPRRMEQFRRELMDGTYKPDPELLKLAQAAVERRNAGVLACSSCRNEPVCKEAGECRYGCFRTVGVAIPLKPVTGEPQ